MLDEMQPDSPPPAPPPVVGVTDVPVTCMNCGFNLSGTALGSRCPECGTSVRETIQSRQQTTSNGAMVACAWTGFGFSIAGFLLCGLLGVVGLVLGLVAVGRTDGSAKVAAWIAIALGGLAVLFGIAMAVFFAVASSGSF